MHPYNTISIEKTIERLRRFEQSVANADAKLKKAIDEQDVAGMAGAQYAKESCEAEVKSIRKDLSRSKELIEAALR